MIRGKIGTVPFVAHVAHATPPYFRIEFESKRLDTIVSHLLGKNSNDAGKAAMELGIFLADLGATIETEEA